MVLQMEIETATVAKSKAGKTRAARSDWAQSQVFSSDDEEEATVKGGKSRASLWGDAPGKSSRPAKSHAPPRKVFSSTTSTLFSFFWWSRNRQGKVKLGEHLLAIECE